MDLNSLPQISFFTTDVAEIERQLISDFETLSGKTLYPGDPVRLFLSGLAYVQALQYFLAETALKQNFLAYSKEGNLEHLGALLDVERIPASGATVDVQFSRVIGSTGAVFIPAGTRVSPDGQLFFAVKSAGTVLSGTPHAVLKCVCIQTGTAGNGYMPGQIQTLIDPIAGIAGVINTSTSSGGYETESDDRLRERIRIAPQKFSTAGPTGAYQYWAATAHADIVDVSVISPTPGTVEIYPLMSGGNLPSGEILSLVNSVVNDSKRRPLTDNVSVLAPAAVNYDIQLSYYIHSSASSVGDSIQTAVSKAVDDFVIWQKSAIGRDLNPSELVRRVINAGAKRVVITHPSYAEIDKTSVAVAENISVTFAGYEDE
ncbi:baseplate assembly protein [Geovibrio ferrireducens]|uniref:baseplate assembly protein n=1 Tax=Geovibrio ferrireducens TaxID=46201 RepID=UPI002245467B|nr:baseplate J/gp47 family protein [Geovibrio ferrireducens]